MPMITPIAPVLSEVTAKTQPKPVKPQPVETPKEPIAAQATELPGAVNQPNTTETAKDEANNQLPPEYKALARKESEIRTLEKDLKAREAALQTQVDSAVQKALSDYKAKLKSTPLDVLNDEGVTYDQLVEQAVNAPDPQTRTIQTKIEALEQKISQQAESSAAREKQQRETAINQIRVNAKSLVESDPEFETIKGMDKSEEIVTRIVKKFDETGELLTVEKAAKEVEEELFQQAVKYAGLNKVKAKLTPAVVEEITTPATKEQQPIKTLTHDMTVTRPLSARERAIARFKGEKF